MKKLFLLLSFFWVFAFIGNGQTITIGSGTTTTTTLPISSCYGYTYSQQIYTQAQIGMAGTIEKIRFYYVSGVTTSSLNWTVYIGHTTKTTFASTTDWVPLANMTQVFSGNVTYPAAGNWMEIVLSTPFAYNNTNNLVIAVDENTPGYECSINWRSFTSGTNTGIYYRADATNPDPASPPTASSRTATLAQVQLAFQEACSSPNGLTATNITTTSATIGWNAPANAPGSGYQWEVRTTGAGGTPQPDFSGSTAAGVTSANVSGLTNATTYNLYVRSNCGAGGFSSWAGPYPFATLATPINTFPYAESFESTTFAPPGWTNVKTAGTGTPGIWDRQTAGTFPTCAPQDGAAMIRYNCFSFSSGTKGELTSRAIDFPAGNYKVAFWMYRDVSYATSADLVNIYVNTTPGSAGGTLLGTINRSTTLSPAVPAEGWYPYEFQIPSGAGIKYIVFEGVSAYGGNIFLDNMVVSEVPNTMLSWYNLQWPPSATIAENQYATVYAQCWEDGVTNQPGPGVGIETWIGYSQDDTNPETWTNWVPASYNVEVGNNDEYMADLGLPQGLMPGTYYYASRFRYLNGPFTYGGYQGGPWDGTNNVSGVLTVTECGAFPVPFTENFDAVTTPALPICWKKEVGSTSSFAYVQTSTSGTPASLPNQVSLYNSGDAAANLVLISPPVASPLNGLRARFSAKASAGYTLQVGTYSETKGVFNLIETITLTANHAEYIVSFSGYNGADNKIAFKHGLGGTYRTIYLDNITIEQLPPPCAVPPAQPTGLLLTSTSTSVNGEFTGSGATGYLVVRHTASTLGGTPTNGINYNAGDAIGNGTVVYRGTGTTFNTTGLTAFTQYYFFVFAYNSQTTCSGPVYRTTAPLTGNVTTKPGAPAAFTATAVSSSAVSFAVTPNTQGHNIIVAWNTTNVFGEPTGAYTVGAPITGGGTVHYVGSAAGLYNHTGLTSGSTYYYRVWSVVAGPTYSTNFINDNATTYFGVPFFEDFNASISLPGGWAGTGTSFSVISNHGTNGSNGLSKNIYETVPTANVTTPVVFLPNNGCRLMFDYRIVNWSGYPNTATPNAPGNTIELQISTNGTDFETLYLIDETNHIESTQFAKVIIPLSVYSGLIQIKIIGTWATGDFYIDIDNFNIEITPTEPIISINPNQKDFAIVPINAFSPPQVFTITNIGVGLLGIDEVELIGQDADQFVLTDINNYPINLAEGEAINFEVKFSPTTGGSKTAVIRITDNLGNKTVHSINLTGEGFDPTVTSFPFKETFEPNSPTLMGWTSFNQDGAGVSWGITTDKNHTPNVSPGRSAVHNYGAQQYNEIGWYISPPLIIPSDADYTLSFWSYNSYPNDYGNNSVWVSRNGENFNLIWTTEAVVEPWTETIIPLTDYAGETIILAFRYEGTYAHRWYLDDVLINTPLVVTHEFTPLSCYQSNDGTISLDIVGGATPYTIVWTGPDGFTSDQQYLTGLAAGQYQYSVADGDGIVASDFVTLTQPDEVPAPQIGDTQFVYDGTVQTVEAIAPAGTELVWYDAPEGGDVTEAPTASDAGVYPAWVAAFNAQLGCESARVDATMTIEKRSLTVTADNKSKCQNTPNPELTITYSGFAPGENAENLETAPMASTTATINSLPNTYPITVSGGISNNYSFVYVNGTLTVIASPMVDAGDDGFVCVSEAFPIVDATASNFTTVLWSTSGNGTFNNVNAVKPIYTPGSTDIANGSVTLTITGNPGSACAMSDDMLLTIQNDLPVSVTISLNTPEICNGTLVSFSALPVNGGLAPSYQWKVNGTNSGTNSPDFEYVPADGDVVTVVLTSSIGCALNNPATSNAITVNVTPDLTAEVSIDADATDVCDFTPVTFTAYPVNGGMNPSYQWLVNGETAGTNSATFTYAPLDGDAVSVVMTSSHLCAVVPVATSNVITMNVAPPLLELVANPANGGTVSGGGNYANGSVVTLTATPSSGWEFLNWKNLDGDIVSTNAEFDYTINKCYDKLFAIFSSTARIAGQLKYFNAIETTIPSAGNNVQFYVQLFENGLPHSDRQLVKYNPALGLDSYFEFIGAESGKDYTLKVYEQPTSNLLGNTWVWNNWGGISAIDALIINHMSVGNLPVVSYFPWILPAGSTDYTPLFTDVADINGDGNILGSDPLLLMFRAIGRPGYSPFPGGKHNFQLATTKLAAHAEKAHPVAPEIIFGQNGTFTATTPASNVYYEAELTNLNDGLNVFNVYFVATGDMNASYVPGTAAKAGVNLEFNNVIAANVGDEIVIPVMINQSVELGAITLGLSYNTDLVEIIEVPGFDMTNIDASQGVVRIAWIDQAGKSYFNGQELLMLKARVLSEISAGTAYMSLLEETEFGDRNATAINDVSLSASYIETGVTSISDLNNLKLHHQIVPNPFSDMTQIQYTLPVTGKVRVDVYNHLGQMVVTLVDEMQQAGAHKLLLNNYDLNGAGSYFYQISVDAEGQRFTERGTIVMTK